MRDFENFTAQKWVPTVLATWTLELSTLTSAPILVFLSSLKVTATLLST